MNNLIVIRDHISDHFNLITYPDGQRNIKLNLELLTVKELISIKCSVKSFSDLEVLSCVIGALRNNDFYIQTLEFVYLFGMRSDRSFLKGQPNYFRDVVAPIINSYNIREIYMYEPHSDISLCAINNSSKYYFNINYHPLIISNSSNLFFICGDKSTTHFMGNSVCYFNKTRNGNDIHVDLHQDILEALKALREDVSIIIIDDLCDAGGTFIAEAKYLREKSVKNKLWLYVYHGLFTKGLDPLLEHFDKIICTNSYQDIIHPRVEQIKVI